MINHNEKRWRCAKTRSGKTLVFMDGDLRTLHEVKDAAMALYGLRIQSDSEVVEVTDEEGVTRSL